MAAWAWPKAMAKISGEALSASEKIELSHAKAVHLNAKVHNLANGKKNGNHGRWFGAGLSMDRQVNDIPIKILVIDDDDEDFLILGRMLSSIPQLRYTLDYASTYQAGLEELRRGVHDLYFLDYRLGSQTGLELLVEAAGRRNEAPVIFLTGQGDYFADMEAMHSGASDYMTKEEINPETLERAIRYNIERKRTEASLRRSREKLHHLSVELLRAQEKERSRIALELHDSVGQMLTAIKFTVEAYYDNLDESTRERMAVTQSNLVQMVKQTVEEVREISIKLRPPVLENKDLGGAVRWFCSNFASTYPRIRVEKHIELDHAHLPEDLEITVFRVLQEAMNNVAKHSGATSVRVLLSESQGELILAIEDDGGGFDAQSAKAGQHGDRPGLGIKGMRERAELFGGGLAIQSSPGHGTAIKVRWPVNTHTPPARTGTA